VSAGLVLTSISHTAAVSRVKTNEHDKTGKMMGRGQ